jgi:hypothetical protein
LTPSDIGAAPAASPTFTGNATFTASSGVPLTVTNTGSGNSFVVNDEASDTTPFVINASGLVGVNAEPTTRRLTVRGSSTGDGALLLQSSSTGAGTSNGFIIQCFGASSDAYVWNFENSPIIFGANNAERMRLYADGTLDVTGRVWVPAGTAAAPGVAFRNDQNTGLFGPAADTVAISTAGVERVRVDSSGRVGLPSISANHLLHVSRTATGASTQIGVGAECAIASDVTTQFVGFRTNPSLATAFSMANVWHYQAAQFNSLPASAAITNAYGFGVTASVGGKATNTYGIWSDLASATTTWNVYAGGTAPNYFAGNVGIATTTPTEKLDINSDKIRLRTAKTPASSSDTGNTGDICWDASYLYICTATNTWRRIAHSTW